MSAHLSLTPESKVEAVCVPLLDPVSWYKTTDDDNGRRTTDDDGRRRADDGRRRLF